MSCQQFAHQESKWIKASFHYREQQQRLADVSEQSQHNHTVVCNNYTQDQLYTSSRNVSHLLCPRALRRGVRPQSQGLGRSCSTCCGPRVPGELPLVPCSASLQSDSRAQRSNGTLPCVVPAPRSSNRPCAYETGCDQGCRDSTNRSRTTTI